MRASRGTGGGETGAPVVTDEDNQPRCMICGRFAPSDDPEQWRCYHCDTLICPDEYDPCFTPHAYEDHVAPSSEEAAW